MPQPSHCGSTPPIPLEVMAENAERVLAEFLEAERRLESLQAELRWWEEAADMWSVDV